GWDLQTFQCIETLNDHADAVMSVLCWDSFLLSGSLDSTIKVWAATESGNLEVVYLTSLEVVYFTGHATGQLFV
ncbi:unnamed protein product, partial [Ilex paraguariensis]